MKILISIFSSEKHINSRISFIKNSWLKDVDNYIIISDYDDIKNRTYQLSRDNSYVSNVEKNFKSFHFLYENFLEFDWFINLDDDTFLNYPNLVDLVKTLPKDEIFLLGKINEGSLPSDRSLNYCSGGAGYLFNRITLNLLRRIDDSYNRTIFADANIGFFCRENQIKLINNDLFHPTTPSFYHYDNNKIKNSISFHYIFGEEFNNLYKIIKNE
jgi:hypothetical protein